jgi:hypothetical protein
MQSNTVELWVYPGALRCTMRPFRDGWEVCLLRQRHVLKSDVFVDAAAAVAASDEWRRRLDDSHDETLALDS